MNNERRTYPSHWAPLGHNPPKLELSTVAESQTRFPPDVEILPAWYKRYDTHNSRR